MSSKIIITLVSFLISAAAGYFIFIKNSEVKVPVEEKVNSEVSVTVTQTPTPSPLPKSTPYTGEVDLNKELEAVEPQVKESDFNDLNQLITEFN